MMNAAQGSANVFSQNRKSLFLLILFLLVAVSAISVSYSVHLSRAYVSEMSQLNKQQDDLQVQWEKLLVEINMLTAYNRVEQQAIKKLGMSAPNEGQVRIMDLRKVN